MRLTDRLANAEWIAGVFYPLGIMLMEVLWLHPWLTWAGIWAEPDWERAPLSLVSLIILVAGAFFVTRASSRPGKKVIWMQMGILLLVIFTVIRIEHAAGYPLPESEWFTYAGRSILDSTGPLVLALATAFFITWRGISLGRSPLYFNDVARYFIFGLVALVLLIVTWRASMGVGSLESLVSTVGLQVAGFFFFGLFVLAMGNLQDIQRRMLPGDEKPGSIRRLMPIQLGVVSGIILLGMGVVSIFSTDFVAFLGRILSQVWHFLSLALYYLLMPFDYLARGIAFLVEWLVRVLQGGQPLQPFQTPDFFQQGELPVPHTALPLNIIIVLKWTLFAIAALVMIALLVATLNRIRAMRAGEDIEEIQESLWSWTGLRADLRLVLNNILGRFRRKEKRVAPVITIPDWHLAEDVEEGLDIREIYRRLLWEASSYGVPRHHYETPGEYALRLAETIPETGKQMSELTGIYLDYRYGEREVGASREKQANGIWRALHRLLSRPGAEPAL